MASEPLPAACAPGVVEHDGALEYPGHADAPVRVRALHRSPRERTVRAVKTLAACWALAVVAVFLPLLHFVLVPGLLLLGPVLAWSRRSEARTLLSLEGACPACAMPLRLRLAQPWRERTLLRCEGCGRPLVLVLPPASDA